MAKHLDTGKLGEELAAKYYLEKGFVILEKNWRFKHKEVDLIALKNEIVHFVEVKTKTTEQFGHPEENMGRSKIKFLQQAAEEYFELKKVYTKIQFDVLAITLSAGKDAAYFLLEDVYEY